MYYIPLSSKQWNHDYKFSIFPCLPKVKFCVGNSLKSGLSLQLTGKSSYLTDKDKKSSLSAKQANITFSRSN